MAKRKRPKPGDVVGIPIHWNRDQLSDAIGRETEEIHYLLGQIAAHGRKVKPPWPIPPRTAPPRPRRAKSIETLRRELSDLSAKKVWLHEQWAKLSGPIVPGEIVLEQSQILGQEERRRAAQLNALAEWLLGGRQFEEFHRDWQQHQKDHGPLKPIHLSPLKLDELAQCDGLSWQQPTGLFHQFPKESIQAQQDGLSWLLKTRIGETTDSKRWRAAMALHWLADNQKALSAFTDSLRQPGKPGRKRNKTMKDWPLALAYRIARRFCQSEKAAILRVGDAAYGPGVVKILASTGKPNARGKSIREAHSRLKTHMAWRRWARDEFNRFREQCPEKRGRADAFVTRLCIQAARAARPGTGK